MKLIRSDTFFMVSYKVLQDDLRFFHIEIAGYGKIKEIFFEEQTATKHAKKIIMSLCQG